MSLAAVFVAWSLTVSTHLLFIHFACWSCCSGSLLFLSFAHACFGNTLSRYPQRSAAIMANIKELQGSELTQPAILQDYAEPSYLATLMASSEVDQKFLGQFAKETSIDNPFLSSMLYKVLGLSVILWKKLIRARKLRKLDTTRDTKSLQLYHHIIWLTREGLVMVEQYVLPMVPDYRELKVLAYKLRASFYHVLVLFHNQPSINQTSIPSLVAEGTPCMDKGKSSDRGSIRSSPTRSNPMEGGPVGGGSRPPGLAPVSIPKPSASFLLPATDYVPTATSSFITAATLADRILPGSHPLRISVKHEYAAFLYDCLHDAEGSRRLAQQTIDEVYGSQEAIDDDMYEDASEMVHILNKFVIRALHGTPDSTPGMGSGNSRTPVTPRKAVPTRNDTGVVPATPSPGMNNPI